MRKERQTMGATVVLGDLEALRLKADEIWESELELTVRVKLLTELRQRAILEFGEQTVNEVMKASAAVHNKT